MVQSMHSTTPRVATVSVRSALTRLAPAVVGLAIVIVSTAVFAADRTVPFFEGLGSHTRRIETSNAEAQRYFDQGLNLLFAFNHDEAIRSFQKAADLDPECAMAWLGVALAHGPHINNIAVPKERAAAAWAALQRALQASHATATERALIEALQSRYRDPQPSDRVPLDIAYANAMRAVWHQHAEDADIGALFAEALMDLRPWDLWTDTGKAQPGTGEVLSVLESVLTLQPQHPLALHLYIHAVEASPNPEKADAVADRLRELTPGLGHLVHMPSHIDVRRGRWLQAMLANNNAMEADRKYRAIEPRQGFYRVYMSHNHHMLAYAAMMIGRSGDATRVIDAMVTQIPTDLGDDLRPVVDGYLAMPLEVRMRFGRWQEILDAPELPEGFPLARTLRLYARGIAYAAQGNTKAARQEQRQFLKARAALPKSAVFGNNSATALLAVAAPFLEGEILLREGKTKAGIAALRQAVSAEDKLRYNEPPDWIQPTRHALGASLLQNKAYSQAEEVFREDLRRLPDNGWSLYGLARSLYLQDKPDQAQAVQARFEEIWSQADVPLFSPCFCQRGLEQAARSNSSR